MTTIALDKLLLYRGVDQEMHAQGVGLRPRNSKRAFRRDVHCDGTWKYNGSVTYGDQTSQTVHAHQLDSEAFDGPGLSFSLDESVARHFATQGGMSPGVVYVVSVQHLKTLGCSLFEPREHTAALQNPAEAEVVVVPPTDVTLTLEHMARIIEVD